MKNKHNTMNSSSSQKTYMRMQNTLLENNKATCMLVEVIAKNSQNIPWKCSLDGKSVSNEKIKRVSIDQFYGIVTGDKHSFIKLCKILPTVIHDIVEEIGNSLGENSVLDELKKISPNIMKSIFQLSFNKYEGFEEVYK